MRVLVTGASGFLGRAIVAEALRSGHQVRGVSRTRAAQGQLAGAEIVQLDLLVNSNIADALRGIDAVVHAAASPLGRTGPWSDTVTLTDRLLAAMTEARIQRLILLSSMAVLDYARLEPGVLVTETTQIESEPQRRDGYTQAKIRQEQLTRNWAEADGRNLTILRPGPVVSIDKPWTPRLGFRLGRAWIRIGRNAEIPLVHVRACAVAVVAALVDDQSRKVRLFHVLNTRPPTQLEYAEALAKRGWIGRPIVSLSYRLARHLARAKPSLGPAGFEARFKPLRYDNAHVRPLLGPHASGDVLQWMDQHAPV